MKSLNTLKYPLIIFFVILWNATAQIKFDIPDELRQEEEKKEGLNYGEPAETPTSKQNDSEAGTEPEQDSEVELVSENFAALEPDVSESAGSIVGQIIDKETGAYVPEVYVLLKYSGAGRDEDVGSEEYYAETGAQGEYVMNNVEPGIYNMEVIKSGYQPITVTDIELDPESIGRYDLGLVPLGPEVSEDVYTLTDFVVSAEEVLSSQDQLIELRVASAGMVDFLSMEDFAKFGGSDLSDLVSRMAGVNVVEGQFAVVRGLGDRYNSTLVNGLPMPSPDPLRQGLQLDLFPTSMMDSIVAEKSFVPKLPGNSSGAAFDLGTRKYPDDSMVWFEAGVRFNENAKDVFLENPNAPDLSGMLSGDGPSAGGFGGISGGSGFSDYAGTKFRAGAGKRFELGDGEGPVIGLIVAASADSSRSTDIGQQQDFFATPDSYTSTPPGFGRFRRGNPGSLYEKELGGSGFLYDYTASEEKALAGVLVGTGVDFDGTGKNTVDFNYLFARTATSKVVRKDNGFLTGPGGFGFARNAGGNSLNDLGNAIMGRTRGPEVFIQGDDSLSYEERNLYAAQFLGNHEIDFLEGLNLSWGYTDASTSSEQGDPDSTDFVSGQTVTTYLRNESGSDFTIGGKTYAPGDFIFANSAAFADNISLPFTTETARTIQEDLTGGRIDLEYAHEADIFFVDGIDFSGGIFVSEAERDVRQFDKETFISTFTDGGQRSIDELAENVFDPGGVSSVTEEFPSFSQTSREVKEQYYNMAWKLFEEDDRIFFDEIELGTGFRSSGISMAAQGDSRLINTIRLQDVLDGPVAGNPDLTNGELIGFTDTTVPSEIDEDYILPAATLKLGFMESWTIRLGYGETYALPSLRELSPYFSRDIATGDRILGNPNLQVSDIKNYNFRIEKEFDDASVALSLFYKTIDQPVEQIGIVHQSTGSAIQTFFNNPGEAEVQGIELEGRTGLGFISKSLADFSVSGNISLIEATVPYPESILSTYFSTTRAGAPSGPFVGPDGPPLGNNNLPEERRLFDQPEWTANFDITYDNEDWGTTATLALYTQSEVLTSVGSGSAQTVAQFTKEYYQLDFKLSQQVFDNWTLKFEVNNLTDTERGVFYSEQLVDNPPDRQTYKVGRAYSLSASYSF